MDSFEVENFRSLKYLKLEKLARVNLLVGKNNSGKTSVLEAIWSLLTIKGSQWLSAIEEERGMEQERMDFQYLFYGFNTAQSININATYDGQEVKQEFRAKLYLQHKQVQQGTDRGFREQRLSNSRKEGNLSMEIELTGSAIAQMISFSLYHSDDGENWLVPNSPESAEFLNSSSPYSRNRACEIVTTNIDRALLSRKIEELKVNKDDAGLLDVMRLIDSRIQKIDLLASGAIYLDLGDSFRKLMPLNLMGEGIQRLLDITSAIADTAGGMVSIDEIDNGLHYSILRILWKGILFAARKYDVQVIVTTHSAEALRHLTWVLDDEEYKGYRDDVAAYTLIRAKDDTVRSYRYDYEQLDFAMEHDIEVRN